MQVQVFETDGAAELWTTVLGSTSGPNWRKQSSRVGETLEAMRSFLVLRNPRRRWTINRTPPLNPSFAIAEVVWIINGDNRLSFLDPWNSKYKEFVGASEYVYGAYGYRLRKAFGIDQI